MYIPLRAHFHCTTKRFVLFFLNPSPFHFRYYYRSMRIFHVPLYFKWYLTSLTCLKKIVQCTHCSHYCVFSRSQITIRLPILLYNTTTVHHYNIYSPLSYTPSLTTTRTVFVKSFKYKYTAGWMKSVGSPYDIRVQYDVYIMRKCFLMKE